VGGVPVLRCPCCEADPSSHCFFSIGADRRGWQAIYCCPPRSKLKDAASSVDHALAVLEGAMRVAQPNGGAKFVLLVDLHGFGVRDISPATASRSVSAILTHYPGTIGQVCLLDSPWIFKATWSMISSMIDTSTAAQVKTLRGDAMHTYFAEHLMPEQAAFLTEVLLMTATPGSLPESTLLLKQPIDQRIPTERL